MGRDRSLNTLDARFKPLAIELLARLVESCILVMIIETRRTEEQHLADVASGHSWVKHSKHQDGLAIDICPYFIWQEVGEDKLQWDAADPIWQRIGAIGEQIGLVWGGRWTHKDMGHFELKEGA